MEVSEGPEGPEGPEGQPEGHGQDRVEFTPGAEGAKWAEFTHCPECRVEFTPGAEGAKWAEFTPRECLVEFTPGTEGTKWVEFTPQEYLVEFTPGAEGAGLELKAGAGGAGGGGAGARGAGGQAEFTLQVSQAEFTQGLEGAVNWCDNPRHGGRWAGAWREWPKGPVRKLHKNWMQCRAAPIDSLQGSSHQQFWWVQD
eukprot:1925848-Rhodomonas_salina.1